MPQLTRAARTPFSQNVPADLDTNMNSYSFCGYTLDPSQHLLMRGEEPVDLTPRAFDVLLLLVENAGKTVSKETILERVWSGNFVEESNISVQISSLRNTLADTLEADLIRTVHSKGYCFTAPVTVTPTAGMVIADESASDSAREFSIAVLPIANESGDEEFGYIAEALTDCLTNGITRVKGLRVVPRDAAMRHAEYNGRLSQIASELRVSHLLVGRMRSQDSDIVANFELIDVEEEDQLWGEQLRLDPSNLLELQKSSTEKISDLVISELGLSRSAFTFTSTTRSPESHRLYLKGKYLFDQRTAEQIKKAIQCFETASLKDPANVSAYVSLVEAYRLMYGFDLISFEEATEVIEPLISTTLELDGDCDLVLNMLGGVKLYFHWDFTGAETVLKRAVRINGTNLDSRYRLSDILLANRKFVDALREFNEILEIDPASPTTLKRIGKAFYRMGQFKNAKYYIEEVLELAGTDFEALAVLSAINIEMGDFETARGNLNDSLSFEYNVDVASMMGYLLAKEGKHSDAQNWMSNFCSEFGARYPLKLARIHGALGDRDTAFALIDDAISNHEIDLICLQSDPRWDSIMDDPRFDVALAKVGFRNQP